MAHVYSGPEDWISYNSYTYLTYSKLSHTLTHTSVNYFTAFQLHEQGIDHNCPQLKSCEVNTQLRLCK